MASPLPKERDILIKHYAKLTSTVKDVDNLLPHFVTAKIINSDDVDEIKAIARTSERVGKLLKFISGPLDAGFTKSFYKMLDIMYYYGNDSTKELAIAMGRKEDSAVRSPLGTPTSPTAQYEQRHSSSNSSVHSPTVRDQQRHSSSNSSVYSPTGEETARIKPEVVFDEEDGKGIICDDVMDETKKAVCRIRAAQMMGTGFIGYLGVGREHFTVLVTNHHVIQTLDDAMSCRLKFENAFDRGQHCTVKLCDAISEEPDNFWTSSIYELDFTIVRLTDAKLKDTGTGQSLDINPIILSRPADIKNRDQIYVIQYPHGGNLSLSASSCCLKGPLLLYKSGTTNGSSGSPVLKEVNGVLVPVALHRGGNTSTPQYRGCNFGTLISEILKYLSGQQYLPLPNEQEVQAVLGEHQ